MGSSSHQRTLEFGGAIGAAGIVVTLPFWILFVQLVSQQWEWTLFDPEKYLSFSVYTAWNDFFVPSKYTLSLVLGWIGTHVFLYFAIPGKKAKGLPDPDTGKVLEYPVNAFQGYLLSIFATFALYSLDIYSPSRILANFGRLASTSLLVSIALSIFLYIKAGFAEIQHRSGSFFYDFYMGVERHPRIGSFDLKYFFELRPGLTAWSCFTWVCVLAVHESNRPIQYAQIVSAILQSLYVIDALYFEEAVLSTLDIVNDEFGYMLAVGNLSFLPFLYPLSSLYLVDHSPQWPAAVWVAILIAGLLAMKAFRESNSERDLQKQGKLPNAKTFTMVRFDGTSTQYLISGYSSLARRPNYWPDLLNSSLYALCTGFSAPIAWIYPVMFFVLLTHRQHRLEQKGRRTYKNWDDYCRVVPYRYIPYII